MKNRVKNGQLRALIRGNWYNHIHIYFISLLHNIQNCILCIVIDTISFVYYVIDI